MRCAGTFNKWVGSLVPYAAPVPGRPDASIKVICASGLLRRRCIAASTPAAPPPTIATRIIDGRLYLADLVEAEIAEEHCQGTQMLPAAELDGFDHQQQRADSQVAAQGDHAEPGPRRPRDRL